MRDKPERRAATEDARRMAVSTRRMRDRLDQSTAEIDELLARSKRLIRECRETLEKPDLQTPDARAVNGPRYRKEPKTGRSGH